MAHVNIKTLYEKAQTFLRRNPRQFWNESRNPKVMRLREDLELGQFAQAYNRTHKQRFIYAEHHTRNSRRGDFAVFGSSGRWVCDIELTKCFEHGRAPELEDHRPGRERLVDLEKNRGIDPYADLPSIVEKHLRSYQRRYWLVVYDNVMRIFYPDLSTTSEQIISEVLNNARVIPKTLSEVWVVRTGPSCTRLLPP